jgi:3-isopropylmalate dehydrogenase
MKYKLTLLPGDGIGPEVVEASLKVMHYVAEKFNVNVETQEHLMGGCSFDAHGTPLTEETIQACYDSDAVLLGAVGGYKWENLEHHLKPEAALLKLRKSLGLFANIRPAKVYSSFVHSSSLKSEVLKELTLLCFENLTGGIYFGEPRGFDEERGYNTMVYSKAEVERIAHMAFKTAAIERVLLLVLIKQMYWKYHSFGEMLLKKSRSSILISN